MNMFSWLMSLALLYETFGKYTDMHMDHVLVLHIYKHYFREYIDPSVSNSHTYIHVYVCVCCRELQLHATQRYIGKPRDVNESGNLMDNNISNPNSHGKDKDLAKKLWEFSLTLTGEEKS